MALAFEYAKTEEKAFNNIKRLKERTGIDYPVLLAQVGTSSKMKANEKRVNVKKHAQLVRLRLGTRLPVYLPL